MIAEVVALLMFIGPEIKEHRIQPSMSVCLNINVKQVEQFKMI